MFTSSADIVAMPCGHYLHHTCYLAYMESAYKCPICKKSAVNMELQWRKLEHAIESQPMPPQFRETKVEIRCNDCGGRGVVPYHWLGNKCGVCDGFNTNEVRLLGADEGTRHDVAVYAEEERSHRRAREEAGRRRFQQQLLQPRSYFADEDGSNGAAPTTVSAGDDSVGGRFALPALPTLNVSPYEMLERVSRSLSPIRHYFDSDDALNNPTRPWSVGREASPTSATTGDEELGFWARNRHWFMSSEGEDDYSGDDSTEGEDDEDEEMESDMDDDDDGDDDVDDDDSSEDGELNLRLIGHR